MLIACSFGGIQSILWAVYFSLFTPKRSQGNYLLGGLFLALSVRVLKSTYFLFSDEMSMLFINLGFAAHLLVGPLLLYYLLNFKEDRALSWHFWLQLLPGVAVAVLSPWLTLYDFWYVGGYTALLFQSVAYIPVVLYLGWKLTPGQTRVQSAWIILLIIGVSVVLLAYFSNYVLRISSYVYGPVIYAAVTYVFSFFLLKNFQKLRAEKKEKYQNIRQSKDRFAEYKRTILTHFDTGEPYLQNNYTLSRLSEETKIPKHLLSPLFSESFEMSFTDFLNSYRIEVAKRLLIEQPNITVSAVAYDCGFNTLSSFNQAFKRVTQTTPSAYRKTLLAVG